MCNFFQGSESRKDLQKRIGYPYPYPVPVWKQFLDISILLQTHYPAGYPTGKPDSGHLWLVANRDEHGPGLDRTGSGLKPILAGSRLDRTAISLKIDVAGLDRTEKNFVVLIWLFWKYQKF